jgi:hypothetical protein
VVFVARFRRIAIAVKTRHVVIVVIRLD